MDWVERRPVRLDPGFFLRLSQHGFGCRLLLVDGACDKTILAIQWSGRT